MCLSANQITELKKYRVLLYNIRDSKYPSLAISKKPQALYKILRIVKDPILKTVDTMNKMILMSSDIYNRLISEKTPTIIKSDNTQCETVPETIGDKMDSMSNKLDRALILVFLSPKMKRRAEVLLSLTCLDWDDKGQLIYRGSPVNGSHMVDLVKLCFFRSSLTIVI